MSGRPPCAGLRDRQLHLAHVDDPIGHWPWPSPSSSVCVGRDLPVARRGYRVVVVLLATSEVGAGISAEQVLLGEVDVRHLVGGRDRRWCTGWPDGEQVEGERGWWPIEGARFAVVPSDVLAGRVTGRAGGDEPADEASRRRSRRRSCRVPVAEASVSIDLKSVPRASARASASWRLASGPGRRPWTRRRRGRWVVDDAIDRLGADRGDAGRD